MEPQVVLWLQVGLLVACRVGPTALWAPFWGGRALPWPVRGGLVLVLTVLLTPMVSQSVSSTPLSAVGLGALALKELALGAAVATVFSSVFWGVQIAGQIADTARAERSGGGSPLDGGASPLSALWGWLSVAVFLSLGGHALVIAALGRSFVAVPLQQSPRWGEGALGAVVALTAEMFALAVLLALPVLASLWIVELVSGVLGRASSGLQRQLAALPLRALVGVLAALVVLHVVVDLAVDGALTAVDAAGGLWP